MRSEDEINHAVDVYGDTVKRICMLHLKNWADTEDIFQNVFLKYALTRKKFESTEHEKAWIIRVTINQCHDLLKSFFKSKTQSLETLKNLPEISPDFINEVLEAVLQLPVKYKDVVYLYYYEGYEAHDIAKLLHKNVNTVYTLLNRARCMLKKVLGDDEDE